ncbi:MAG: hypothetical protein AB2693_15555 [Candidatus Thiodiazotropha sp.]
MSDEELVLQFCLQNKVSKTAAEELLKRGFTSLEALRLVELDDLASEKIPRGQRRLILHIVRTLLQGGADERTSGGTNTGTTDPSTPIAGSSDATGTATGTSVPVIISQEVSTPEVTSQNEATKTNETNTDLYTNLLKNMVAQQQTVIQNSLSDVNPECAQAAQPSWNDPQIHISSACGKSGSNYLDICDFVQCTVVEEDVVLGGQGDKQIIVKSGPKKPRLENLTLSQWSVANLSILYKLVGDNKLSGTALMDYLSYTTKVYQLVQRFSLISVLLFDREYRRLQASMGFRWGTDVQHLHTLFLQPRDKPAAQGNLSKKGISNGQNSGKPNKDKPKEKPVCRNFNTQKGCSFPNCSFRHVCLLPGCFQQHSAQTHVTEKN